jgi:hypothetical protein
MMAGCAIVATRRMIVNPVDRQLIQRPKMVQCRLGRTIGLFWKESSCQEMAYKIVLREVYLD